MAMSPIKRLLLVAFLLLCFISITARAARSLRDNNMKEGSVVVEKANNNNNNDDDDDQHEFKPKQKQGVEQDVADLAAMDYTPAAKNPPIHN